MPATIPFSASSASSCSFSSLSSRCSQSCRNSADQQETANDMKQERPRMPVHVPSVVGSLTDPLACASSLYALGASPIQARSASKWNPAFWSLLRRGEAAYGVRELVTAFWSTAARKHPSSRVPDLPTPICDLRASPEGLRPSASTLVANCRSTLRVVNVQAESTRRVERRRWAGSEGVSAAQDLRLRVRAPLSLSTSTSAKFVLVLVIVIEEVLQRQFSVRCLRHRES